MDEKEEKLPEEQEKQPAEELFTKAQLDELIEKEKEKLTRQLREAEKLSEMDAGEKDAYRRKQADEALAAREAAVYKRELAAEAAERLAECNLPKSLAACVNFSSAEDYEKSLDGLRTAFTEAVKEAVNQRLRGSAPKSVQGGGNDAFLDGLFE